MWTGKEEYKCPLCGRPAQALELVEPAGRRIDCRRCTAYQISEGLERILAANPEARGRAGYLSDAAKRARRTGQCPLELSEDNYLGIAGYEEALQAGE